MDLVTIKNIKRQFTNFTKKKQEFNIKKENVYFIN